MQNANQCAIRNAQFAIVVAPYSLDKIKCLPQKELSYNLDRVDYIICSLAVYL